MKNDSVSKNHACGSHDYSRTSRRMIPHEETNRDPPKEPAKIGILLESHESFESDVATNPMVG
jgi:hypothetical protein